MIKYIIDDFLIIVLVLGFTILLLNNLRFKSEKTNEIKLLLLSVTGMFIFNILELYFSNFSSINIYRLICSFMCYSLRPIVVIIFISLLTDNKNMKYFYGLAGINTLIYATCFFTDIAFSYTSDNHFQRGPLGYSIHIVCIIYLLLLIYLIIKKHNRQSWNRTIILSFMAIISTIAAVLDFISVESSIFDQTVLICVLIYYLFLYMEYNKLDVLTKVYNRMNFYNDINNFKKVITSVISVDMNDLKYINDNYGHDEGDKALITIAKVLQNSDKNRARVYRVGGDEFVMLCLDMKEDKVQELIKKINSDLKKTKYTCSIGYEMTKNNVDINESYKIADKKMYIIKQKYHSKQEKKER